MLKEGRNMPNKLSIGILIAVALSHVGCERPLDGKPCPCDPRLTDICCDGICVAEEQCAVPLSERDDANAPGEEAGDSGHQPANNARADRDDAKAESVEETDDVDVTDPGAD